jgi:acyl phosphate:glycerol-3-phosphate acyltransferase
MRLEYLVPLIGYLLGSIPFGFLLVRSAQGTDIRSVGSGNIGATNVYRKSRWAGVLTLLLDGGKGYLAVSIAKLISADPTWHGIAAVAAIVGHVFTVWLRFKGGKGVATGCGAYLAIAPLAVLITLAVFVLTVTLSRYISLASILATAAFPLWAGLLHHPPQTLVWAVLGSALIVAKHHQNIGRLIAGRENKFEFGRRAS